MPEEKMPHLEKSLEHLDQDLEKLDSSIEELDTSLERSIKSHGLGPTFLRGVVGAVGAAIGGAIVLAALIYLFQYLSGVPIVGDAFSALLNLIQQNK